MWNEMVKDEEITFNGEESAHPGTTPIHTRCYAVCFMTGGVLLVVSGGRGGRGESQNVNFSACCPNFRGLHRLLRSAEEG